MAFFRGSNAASDLLRTLSLEEKDMESNGYHDIMDVLDTPDRCKSVVNVENLPDGYPSEHGDDSRKRTTEFRRHRRPKPNMGFLEFRNKEKSDVQDVNGHKFGSELCLSNAAPALVESVNKDESSYVKNLTSGSSVVGHADGRTRMSRNFAGKNTLFKYKEVKPFPFKGVEREDVIDLSGAPSTDSVSKRYCDDVSLSVTGTSEPALVRCNRNRTTKMSDANASEEMNRVVDDTEKDGSLKDVEMFSFLNNRDFLKRTLETGVESSSHVKSDQDLDCSMHQPPHCASGNSNLVDLTVSGGTLFGQGDTSNRHTATLPRHTWTRRLVRNGYISPRKNQHRSDHSIYHGKNIVDFDGRVDEVRVPYHDDLESNQMRLAATKSSQSVASPKFVKRLVRNGCISPFKGNTIQGDSTSSDVFYSDGLQTYENGNGLKRCSNLTFESHPHGPAEGMRLIKNCASQGVNDMSNTSNDKSAGCNVDVQNNSGLNGLMKTLVSYSTAEQAKDFPHGNSRKIVADELGIGGKLCDENSDGIQREPNSRISATSSGSLRSDKQRQCSQVPSHIGQTRGVSSVHGKKVLVDQAVVFGKRPSHEHGNGNDILTDVELVDKKGKNVVADNGPNAGRSCRTLFYARNHSTNLSSASHCLANNDGESPSDDSLGWRRTHSSTRGLCQSPHNSSKEQRPCNLTSLTERKHKPNKDILVASSGETCDLTANNSSSDSVMAASSLLCLIDPEKEAKRGMGLNSMKRQRKSASSSHTRLGESPSPNIDYSGVIHVPGKQLVRASKRLHDTRASNAINIERVELQSQTLGTDTAISTVNDSAIARQLEADELLAKQLQEQFYRELGGVGGDEMDACIALALQEEENSRNGSLISLSSRNQPPPQRDSAAAGLGRSFRLCSSGSSSTVSGGQSTSTSRRVVRRQHNPVNWRRDRFPPNMNIDRRVQLLEVLEEIIGDDDDAEDFPDRFGFLDVAGDLNQNNYEMLLALDNNNHSHTGATDGLINRLPLSQVQSGFSEEACAVCLEVPSMGECVRHLPCLHKFHKDCIDPWLRRRPSCPICKSGIT